MKLLYLFIFFISISNIALADGVCCDVAKLGRECGDKGADSVYYACHCDVHPEDCIISSTTEISSISGDRETTTSPPGDVGDRCGSGAGCASCKAGLVCSGATFGQCNGTCKEDDDDDEGECECDLGGHPECGTCPDTMVCSAVQGQTCGKCVKDECLEKEGEVLVTCSNGAKICCPSERDENQNLIRPVAISCSNGKSCSCCAVGEAVDDSGTEPGCQPMKGKKIT